MLKNCRILASMKNIVVSSLCFLMEIAPCNIYEHIDFSFESMIKRVSAALLFIRLHLWLVPINHDLELNGSSGLLPLGFPLGLLVPTSTGLLPKSTAVLGRPVPRALGATEILAILPRIAPEFCWSYQAKPALGILNCELQDLRDAVNINSVLYRTEAFLGKVIRQPWPDKGSSEF